LPYLNHLYLLCWLIHLIWFCLPFWLLASGFVCICSSQRLAGATWTPTLSPPSGRTLLSLSNSKRSDNDLSPLPGFLSLYTNHYVAYMFFNCAWCAELAAVWLIAVVIHTPIWHCRSLVVAVTWEFHFPFFQWLHLDVLLIDKIHWLVMLLCIYGLVHLTCNSVNQFCCYILRKFRDNSNLSD
jgi:hypothetical protein